MVVHLLHMELGVSSNLTITTKRSINIRMTTPTALILGCSHAAGSEMYSEPEIDLDGYNQQTYGMYNSYPSLLAQHLGYHPMNHAIPGGSNDAMFRIWESFINPYSNKVRPDLVIACWTGSERTEIWDYENETWQGLAAGKRAFHALKKDGSLPEGEYLPHMVSNSNELLAYQKQWVTYHTDRWSGRLNKIKNILALNAMANFEAVPVINLISFESINEFSWPSNVFLPMGNNDFSSWAVTAGFKNTENGHYFSDTHKMYAKKVVAALDGKYQVSAN